MEIAANLDNSITQNSSSEEKNIITHTRVLAYTACGMVTAVKILVKLMRLMVMMACVMRSKN